MGWRGCSYACARELIWSPFALPSLHVLAKRTVLRLFSPRLISPRPGTALTLVGALCAGVLLCGAGAQDSDGDDVVDFEDNCPSSFNPNQQDLDGDGQGDACDADEDGDGIEHEFDLCPMSYDPQQQDNDADGRGDVCDDDDDNDTLSDELEALYGTSPSEEDTDGDGFSDAVEIDAQTSPLSAEDYPGHPRPADGSWAGSSYPGCSSSGDEPAVPYDLGLCLILACLALRRRRAAAVSVGAILAVAGLSPGAHGVGFDSRPDVVSGVGPYADVMPALTGDDHGTQVTMRYQYLRNPLVYRYKDGSTFCEAIASDHSGSMGLLVPLTPTFDLGLRGRWTMDRGGCAGFEELHRPGMGDLGLAMVLNSPKARVQKPWLDTVATRVALYYRLPLGDPALFLGDGATGGGLMGATELIGDFYRVAVNYGFELRHQGPDVVPIGSARYGLALAIFRPDDAISGSVEWTGGIGTDGVLTPSGITFSVSHRNGPFFIRVALGSDGAGELPGASPLRMYLDTGFEM